MNPVWIEMRQRLHRRFIEQQDAIQAGLTNQRIQTERILEDVHEVQAAFGAVHRTIQQISIFTTAYPRTSIFLGLVTGTVGAGLFLLRTNVGLSFLRSVVRGLIDYPSPPLRIENPGFTNLPIIPQVVDPNANPSIFRALVKWLQDNCNMSREQAEGVAGGAVGTMAIRAVGRSLRRFILRK